MKVVSIVLAAGMGTRMHSSIPKVMHQICGKTILENVLTTLKKLKPIEIRVVVSQDLVNLNQFKSIQKSYGIKHHVQHERLGTANALSCALNSDCTKPILVISGDTPLVRRKTLKELYSKFKESKADIALLAFKSKKPKGYGRVIVEGDNVIEIVEEKDADPLQKKINLCNAGIYIIDNKLAEKLLSKVKNNNNSGEFYLTDIVKIASSKGLKTVYSIAKEKETLGINTRKQLAEAECIMQTRLRNKIMKTGVTLIDPKTVYLSHDTEIGKDSIVYPNVYFDTKVKIGENCIVHPFSHLSGVTIEENCNVGPFARIRPNTNIGKNSRIGNFVEIKAMSLGSNVKASHLSYLGDGEIGENSNIGAGTILCNYDGYAKHRTSIGKDVFIGSNVALVAPINIGDRAIVGAGSVLTENVDDDALSIGRARQVNFKQKAELIRKKKSEEVK